MIHLLDISTLLARLIESHEFHAEVCQWMKGKTLAICPLSELGFLRIAQQAYGISQEDARAVLEDFCTCERVKFLACDQSALAGRAATSARLTTDFYLANLAKAHGMKWATLDLDVKHPAAVLAR